MALPKRYRLKHRRDFSAVYRAGLRRDAPHLSLRALRVPNGYVSLDPASLDRLGAVQPEMVDVTLMPTRIGISISQKVSKRAVDRNRIKRRIRAALRYLLPELFPGWLVVITVRPGTAECGYEEFLRELKQLLTKAEVLDGGSGRRFL